MFVSLGHMTGTFPFSFDEILSSYYRVCKSLSNYSGLIEYDVLQICEIHRYGVNFGAPQHLVSSWEGVVWVCPAPKSLNSHDVSIR